jgi:ABC-type branched-subunit amino acid transport system ATPase component
MSLHKVKINLAIPSHTMNSNLDSLTVASKGESAILIGAAGTGKTTTMRGTMEGLIQSGRAGVLHADGHKYLSSGTPEL